MWEPNYKCILVHFSCHLDQVITFASDLQDYWWTLTLSSNQYRRKITEYKMSSWSSLACLTSYWLLLWGCWDWARLYWPLLFLWHDEKRLAVWANASYLHKLNKALNHDLVVLSVFHPRNHLWSSSLSTGTKYMGTSHNIMSCGARGVMVIVAGNGHGDASSNPRRDWLHFILH